MFEEIGVIKTFVRDVTEVFYGPQRGCRCHSGGLWDP